MTICGDGSRDTLASARRAASAVRATWQWTHSIGSDAAERQRAGEHLVEGDAERIEIAARIDRAVHPSGLLGRHVGQRAGDGLGRLGRLALARQARGDAEAGEPRPPVGAVHQDMGGLEVLVDEAALVGFAQGGGDADGEPQEARQLHRRAEQPSERFAAGILEHQHRPTLFADEFERPRRPVAVQLVPQFIVVDEAAEAVGRRAFSGREHDQLGRLLGRRRRGAIRDRRRIRHPATGPGDSRLLAPNPRERASHPTPRHAGARHHRPTATVALSRPPQATIYTNSTS